MEKQQQGQKQPDQQENNKDRNANSAYSGSGSMQPGGDTGEAGKLSDYPDGNIDEVKLQTDSIPGNQTDQPYTEGKSIAEATDPSKLSDL
jgi:hypothetical protein